MKQYETSDFEIKKPLHLIAAVVVVLTAIFAVTYGVLQIVLVSRSSTLTSTRDESREVPPPLLQTNISIHTDIARVMEDQSRFYNRSSVEPRGDGYYRIPLDSAKEHILKAYGGK